MGVVGLAVTLKKGGREIIAAAFYLARPAVSSKADRPVGGYFFLAAFLAGAFFAAFFVAIHCHLLCSVVARDGHIGVPFVHRFH